jgi:hypothetical protein
MLPWSSFANGSQAMMKEMQASTEAKEFSVVGDYDIVLQN